MTQSHGTRGLKMNPKGSIEETGLGPNNKIKLTGSKRKHLRDFIMASRERIEQKSP